MLKTILRSGLLITLFLAGAAQAMACSCGGIGGQCGASGGPIAFVGRVRSIQPVATTAIMGGNAVTFDVLEPLRGTVEKTMVIRADLNGEGCGLPFTVGEDWLIFTDMYQGNLYTGLCSGSSTAKASAALIRQMRAIRAGVKPAELFGLVIQPGRQGDGGTGVEGAANVLVIAKSDLEERLARTGPDGSYEFSGLIEGNYVISVEAPQGREAPPSRLVPVKSVACNRVDIRLIDSAARGQPGG